LAIRARRTLLVIGLTVALFAAITASPALAEGGKTIAGAPIIAFGQQEFGNLNSGASEPAGCGTTRHLEWWLLPVVAGDEVQIDWEISSYESADQLGAILVYPIGTNDFNVGNQNPIVTSSPNSQGKNELDVTSSETGNLVLVVDSDYGSCNQDAPFAYDFTASVSHRVVLGLPQLRRIRSGGLIQVGVHTPDGSPVSGPQPTVKLSILVRGRWRAAGSAAVSDGLAAITASPPAAAIGTSTKLRALSTGGGGYLAATSRTETVRIR
jgi:hypothetical protein